MQPFKHILFPVDFSCSCDATASSVAAMARCFSAKITLLHVMAPYIVSGMPEVPLLVDFDTLRESLKASIDKYCEGEFAGLEVDRRVELGGTAEVITEFAEGNKVDLIMMPTHGYGAFRQFLLGSVTAKVLHDCKVPVWTNAHVETLPASPHAALRSIVCAVDTSDTSRDLMFAASELAKNADSQLRLVHVIESAQVWAEQEAGNLVREMLAREARASIEQTLHKLGVIAQLCVSAGLVPDEVAEIAARYRVDLVVIGRGVIQERLGRLRSNSYGIIRKSPCPVLSF